MTDDIPTITRDGVIGYDATEIVTIDQATGAEFARYPVAGKEEAAAAVAAARSVTGAWWDLGFEGRAERLRAWRRQIALNGEEGAALIHAENGKPLDDARVEVLGTLEHLQYVADNAARVLERWEVPASPTTPNQRAWVEYQPYGVVGVIGPWNFPCSLPRPSSPMRSRPGTPSSSSRARSRPVSPNGSSEPGSVPFRNCRPSCRT